MPSNEMEGLQYVAYCGDITECRRLISEGADINGKDNYNGYTALHWSCINGNLELAKLLVEVGADIKATDNQGANALLLCVAFWGDGKSGLRKWLIEIGCDAQQQDDDGDSAASLFEFICNKNILND